MNANFIDDFEGTILTAFTEMQKISEESASRKKEKINWSIKEIIGHLIDSATNNHQRFVRLQAESKITFPFYQQENFVKFNHYQNQNWLALLDFWKIYNFHLLHIIKNIESHKLKNVWLTSNAERLDLEFIIEDYLAHLKHHLLQIKSKSFD